MLCNPMTPAKSIADYNFHNMSVSATCDLIELCVAAAKQNWALVGLPMTRPLEGHINESPFFALIEFHLCTAKRAVQYLIEISCDDDRTLSIDHAIQTYEMGAVMVWGDELIAA